MHRPLGLSVGWGVGQESQEITVRFRDIDGERGLCSPTVTTYVVYSHTVTFVCSILIDMIVSCVLIYCYCVRRGDHRVRDTGIGAYGSSFSLRSDRFNLRSCGITSTCFGSPIALLSGHSIVGEMVGLSRWCVSSGGATLGDRSAVRWSAARSAAQQTKEKIWWRSSVSRR